MGVAEYQKTVPPAPVHDPHRGRRIHATFMLILLTMIWGMTFPAIKLSVVDTEPMQFLALRFAPALLILMMRRWMVAGTLNSRVKRKFRNEDGPHDPSASDLREADRNAAMIEAGLHLFWVKLRNGPLKSTWHRGLVIGVFLFGGFSLQVLGLEFTTASRSGFFTSLLVVLTPPLALILRTSRAPSAAWLALIPAFTGIYLIADPETGGMNTGDWLTLGCALMFALQMVVLEALTRSDRESHLLTLGQVLVVSVLAVAWTLIEGHPMTITATAWIGIAYTCIFGTVIAVWLQTRYQPEVPAAHAALVFTLEPVFAALFAWILIGDPWTLRGLFGAALIIAAMGISSYSLAMAERAQRRRINGQ